MKISSGDKRLKQHLLPRTPRDLFKLSLKDRIVFNALMTFHGFTGKWKYPMENASGDIETMSLTGKAYWLYKTTHPVRKAEKFSGIEEFFKNQKPFSRTTPQGYVEHSELSVSSAGDLISHRYLKNSRDSLYREVSDILFGSDISMANLECPVFPKANKPFEFRSDAAPPLYYSEEEFDIIKGFAGKKFSFMATACNHSLDFGAHGVDTTIAALNQEGIAYNGINATSSDAFKPTFIEKNGILIAIVAYTFGLNAFSPPDDRPHIVNRAKLNDGVDQADLSQLQFQLNGARAANADFVLAHLHWGMEHEFYPTANQMRMAHHLAEMGVDAIIGHHPHVIQPVEYYRTVRDQYRVVPIFYSLGNLVNAFSAPYLTKSAVAQLQLTKGIGSDGSSKTYVKHCQTIELTQKADSGLEKLELIPG
jgi:poly-gamma-glutamate synthesis protein (capsule biosynthesis protein)